VAWIVFKTPERAPLEWEAETAKTPMAVARDHAIRGIEAECGGASSSVNALTRKRRPVMSRSQHDVLWR
jgi:hypothetical protein